MPTVDGILETALYVDDLERSTQFYQTLFGFEPIASSKRLVALAVASRDVLLLCKRGALVMLGFRRVRQDVEGCLHMAFAIPSGEYDAWKAWLERQGVAIEHELKRELGGHSLFFRDPDGHLIELTTPGTWSIY